MSVPTFTKSGAKATAPAKLPKAVFAEEVTHHELLKSAYVGYLANGRIASATTKTRGDVSGGGKKPWKQKGTGRARFGSSRVPIWRGGGIVFGPTGNENYAQKLNKQAKQLALRQALSLAATENRIVIVEAFESKDGKSKQAAELLAKMQINAPALLVVDTKEDMLVRATRNLSDVKLVAATYLNVYDILNAKTVVMTAKALEIVNQWLGETAPAKEAK